MTPNSILAQAIHDETDRRFFAVRVQSSIQIVFKEKGCLAGGLMVGAMTITQIAALALSYFCMEGSVRSLIEVGKDPRPIVRMRYFGDVGGWTSLAMFSALVVKDVHEKLIGEGEYLNLRHICQKCIQENRSFFEENPSFLEELYLELNKILDFYNEKCLFSKSLISRRIAALEISEESNLIPTNKEHCQDKKLNSIFINLQAEMDKNSYCRQAYEGHTIIMSKMSLNPTVSLVFGIAFPVIFLSNVVLSLIGEFGLGKELFIDKEERTDIGHFGEWPINAIEALVTAFFLYLWYVLNEGNFEITRQIYANEIKNLQHDPEIHNRLCDLASEELSKISMTCNYKKLSLEYKFDKL